MAAPSLRQARWVRALIRLDLGFAISGLTLANTGLRSMVGDAGKKKEEKKSSHFQNYKVRLRIFIQKILQELFDDVWGFYRPTQYTPGSSQ